MSGTLANRASDATGTFELEKEGCREQTGFDTRATSTLHLDMNHKKVIEVQISNRYKNVFKTLLRALTELTASDTLHAEQAALTNMLGKAPLIVCCAPRCRSHCESNMATIICIYQPSHKNLHLPVKPQESAFTKSCVNHNARSEIQSIGPKQVLPRTILQITGILLQLHQLGNVYLLFLSIRSYDAWISQAPLHLHKRGLWKFPQ